MMQNDNDKSRTAHLPRTRCTQAERDAIERKAGEAGLSLSEYQRRACLSGVVVVRNSPAYGHTLRELSAIGNNLNQIARKANIHGGFDPFLAERLQAAIAAVEVVLSEAAQ
jgi:hypothetical protein